MNASSIIGKIRRGLPPDVDELHWFAKGLATGAVSDAQAGAFAMAACLKGLGEAGRVALTEGMRDSGEVLSWDLEGKIVDKHSTGGVGDCTSLIIAPLLAACGVFVPMISGRGLGHTGGTLDKLEAIPGVSTEIPMSRFRAITSEIGCAIVSATGRIAPADKRLYAVRDVTSTIDSIDLITASILSKKLAVGLDALILDVKVGSGAFMKTEDEAVELAETLVGTAQGAGCKTAAVISDMTQPLAPAMGNALEVSICMQVLSGDEKIAPRLRRLCLELAEQVLKLAGWNPALARKRLEQNLADGSALETFARMIAALGGPPDMADDWRTHLPAAPVVGDVTSLTSGYISAIDGEALGNAVVILGGGRQMETDQINPAVGLSDILPLGSKVEQEQPLATLHCADEETAETAALMVRAAITISGRTKPDPLIRQMVT